MDHEIEGLHHADGRLIVLMVCFLQTIAVSCLIHVASWAALVRATCSASTIESAMQVCFLLFQFTTPPLIRKGCPDVDFLASSITTPVGISVFNINSRCIGSEGQTIISSALEVFQDTFHPSPVLLGWLYWEHCNIADCKCDVWSGGHSQVQQPSNSWLILLPINTLSVVFISFVLVSMRVATGFVLSIPNFLSRFSV